MARTRSFSAFLLVAAMALLSSKADACRIGGNELLFHKPPPKDVLVGAEVVEVHFTNIGADFDRASKHVPTDARGFRPAPDEAGATLIGAARILSGATKNATEGYFPVFATVTSCTHGFLIWAGQPQRSMNQNAFMIGRFVRGIGGKLSFYAGGNLNGLWHF